MSMPQPGIHAVLALATRKVFPGKPWFALGLAFGALLPDADSYPQAIAILVARMDPARAEAIFHRTLTHSLFFALAVAIVLWLASLVRGGRGLRTFGFGAATGIAILHIFVDIFAWFDGVGILWPFGSIDLWSWLGLPEIVRSLLRAGNFLAFAWYFAYLGALARRARTDGAYLPRLRWYTWAQLGLGIAFAGLAFLLPAGSYNTIDGAAFLFLAFPNALWVTWKLRATIESGRAA
jgi:membrane-bound metal-dependent hydrolase YbcI (DUF457 family)